MARRARISRTRDGAPDKAPPSPYLRREIPPFEVLGEEQLVQLEDQVDWILQDIGIAYRDDPEALELWRHEGATIDGDIVRAPADWIRALCAKAPREFTQLARNLGQAQDRIHRVLDARCGHDISRRRPLLADRCADRAGHRSAVVEQCDDELVSLGSIVADDRGLGARRRRPIEPSHIVTLAVLTQLVEVGTRASGSDTSNSAVERDPHASAHQVA